MRNDPVLGRIEQELLRAASARHRRRGRRRTAAALSAGSLLTGGVAVAAVTDSNPLANLPLLGWMQPDASGTHQLDIDAAGRPWQVTAYRSQQNALCQTATPDGQPARELGCESGFVLADNFANSGAPLDYHVQRAASSAAGETWLISGVTGDDVQRVTVQAGDERDTAKLSDDRLTVPVDQRPEDLTPEGQRHAQSFPSELSVRLYAATITVPAGTDALEVTVTRNNGDATLQVPPNVLPGG